MDFYPIWLPEGRYPEYQKAGWNTNRAYAMEGMNYCVAEFKKEYTFPVNAVKVRLTATADAFFYAWINGEFTGIGPVSPGGDFLSEGPLSWAFENTYDVDIKPSCRVELRFLVRLQPEALTEYTCCRGTLLAGAEFVLENGETVSAGTDDSWLCRRDTRFVSVDTFDAFAAPDEWTGAQKVANPVRLVKAEIPHLVFEDVRPVSAVREGGRVTYLFDRIYSGYIRVASDTPCSVVLTVFELPEQPLYTLKVTLDGKTDFTSLSMYSVGGITVTGEADVSLWFSHYPVGATGAFETSDKGFNLVMDVCRHTLKICRQTEHIDSPMHQELLACTGDYYIMMLMTLFESGDMRLADADIRRTAMWLLDHDGRMFHTTYSLILVQMIRKLYEFTANKDTLLYCLPALKLLFNRFETYIGDDGVIENPPDYMFVDWTVMEGCSMHHPPKALGQTVLNAFYYKALIDGAYLYSEIGEEPSKLLAKARALKADFNRVFWDDEKQMYIDGLDTPEKHPAKWMPENLSGIRHFSRYPQTLASLYDICPAEQKVRLADIAADESNDLQRVQPYFMHFVLEAVRSAGLTDKYAAELLRKWVPICENCPKGLQEGWIKPEEGYKFDHSHAWGGTPAYHLPLLLTGLEILEPGMKKLRFSPNLLGLEYARVQLPTPTGFVDIRLEKGKEPEITLPEGTEIV